MKSYVNLPAFLARTVVFMLAGYTGEPARAGEFPEKPIRLIIPFPPGGSNDVLGRYIGIKLSDRLVVK